MRRQQPEPRYLAVGRVQRPHGVRGELRMEILTDFPEQLSRLRTLYLGEHQQPHPLEGVRLHHNIALIKLSGIDDRSEADEMRGLLVYVAIEDAVPLEEHEYYEYALEGLEVVTDEGEHLGEIVELFTAPGANDIFIVHGPRGELLIPVTEEIVVSVDLDAERIVIHPLPGLLGDA
jgi:16S rRNA processing protein RimM